MPANVNLVKGTLKVLKKKKGGFYGEVIFSDGKKMPVPTFYEFENENLNNKECEIERLDNGQIKQILIDGVELKRKDKQAANLKGAFGRQGGGFTPGRQQASHTGGMRGQGSPVKREYGQVPSKEVQADSMSYFDIKKSKTPNDTRSILDGQIDNYALRLNKFAYFDDKEKKFRFCKNENNKFLYIKPDFSNIDFTSIKTRRKKMLDDSGLVFTAEKVRTNWRLIPGMGIESVYETSITLHPVYGFPYIPGSAIKGVTRSIIIDELFDQDEEKALQDYGFCIIFGSPKKSILGNLQGVVHFFDAFPNNAPNIEPDIMNPHFSEYYADGNKPPGDYYNPKPIYFLTIRDTEFSFYLGIKRRDNNILKEGRLAGQTPLQLAREYLKKAFSEHGFGAKTAVGYGYFV